MGDNSTLGTLTLGWSVLIGAALVSVIVWCVVLIVRDLRQKAARIVDDASEDLRIR
jgi:hypothetical protein